MGGKLGDGSDALEAARGRCVASLRVHGDRLPSFGEFDDNSWGKNVHLNRLYKMLSSIPDESVWIIGTPFSTKKTNFTNGSKPNGALF